MIISKLSVSPDELNDFFEVDLADWKLSEEQSAGAIKKFYERFGSDSDRLTSVFRRDLFIEVGLYPSKYVLDLAPNPDSKGVREKIHHFEFYLLCNPAASGSFELSSVKDKTIITSKAAFKKFLNKQYKRIEI
jgi:hypothetical protein